MLQASEFDNRTKRFTDEEIARISELEKEIDNGLEKSKGDFSITIDQSKYDARIWNEVACSYRDAGWEIYVGSIQSTAPLGGEIGKKLIIRHSRFAKPLVTPLRK